MNRLTHSTLGYIRALQISSHNLFVFVEGQTHDPYFYDKLCKSVCKSKNIKYVVNDAKQLPGETGGKTKILNFFGHLEENSLLTIDFGGIKKTFVFFVDKDIDDFLGERINSPHLIYTKYYTIENHLFANGNLAEAIAAAASLSENLASEILGKSDDWRKNAAFAWIDWIKISLFARKYNVSCECNFRTQSRINEPLYKKTINQKTYEYYLDLLQKRTGFSDDVFHQKFSELAALVDNLFSQGEYDLLFQGKWYSYFVVEEIKHLRSNVNGLHGKLESTLLVTLDFEKPWANHFVEQLNNVVSVLN